MLPPNGLSGAAYGTLTSSGRFRSAPLTLRWITTRKRLPRSTGRARRKQRSACGRRPPPAPFRCCKSRDMRRVEDQISVRVRTWSSGVQQPRIDTAPAAARSINRPVAPPPGHEGNDDAYPATAGQATAALLRGGAHVAISLLGNDEAANGDRNMLHKRRAASAVASLVTAPPRRRLGTRS